MRKILDFIDDNSAEIWQILIIGQMFIAMIIFVKIANRLNELNANDAMICEKTHIPYVVETNSLNSAYKKVFVK